MKIYIEEIDQSKPDAILSLNNKEARQLGDLIEEAQKKAPDLKKLRRLSKPFFTPFQERLSVF